MTNIPRMNEFVRENILSCIINECVVKVERSGCEKGGKNDLSGVWAKVMKSAGVEVSLSGPKLMRASNKGRPSGYHLQRPSIRNTCRRQKENELFRKWPKISKYILFLMSLIKERECLFLRRLPKP